MIKIACAGDNCVDYYDNTGESFPAEIRSMFRCM